MTRRIWIHALALMALLVATAAWAADPASGLKPFHGLHAEMEVECDSCHESAADSRTGLDDLRPMKSVCADCHDVDDDEACDSCHADSDDPSGYGLARYLVEKFPHAAHLEGGFVCADCHGEATAEPIRPAKSSCRGCHVTASGLSDCQMCHAKTEAPHTHTPDWVSFHGIDAGWDQASCQNCHTQSDCQDCHSGDNVRPRSHRLNYAFEHSLEARGNELLCAGCHQDQSFCSSCHAAEGIIPQDHSRADWLLPVAGGSHGEEARFNMESCIACHESGSEAPLCAQCHGR